GLHGQPEVREYPLDHRGILDRRQYDHASAALRAGEDVGFERPAHEVGPGAILRARAPTRRIIRLVVGGRSVVVATRESESRPAFGVVTWETEGRNQRGEV